VTASEALAGAWPVDAAQRNTGTKREAFILILMITAPPSKLSNQGFVPGKIATEGLASYRAAFKKLKYCRRT
jgi:hypothetical protein